MTERAAGLDGVELWCRYNSAYAVAGVSVRVGPGEVVGFIGPNGAGKTTLLRTLSGLLQPEQGCVLLEGKRLSEYPRLALARLLAFVPQGCELPPGFTVSALVSLGRRPYCPPWRMLSSDDHRAVERAMERADLLHKKHVMVQELSAGEQQRVRLALALAREPRILLLDEPTAHLDVQHAFSFLETVGRLARDSGLAVAISTHDLNLAARFCTRLVLLAQGKKVGEGPPSAVLQANVLQPVYGAAFEAVLLSDGTRVVVPVPSVKSSV